MAKIFKAIQSKFPQQSTAIALACLLFLNACSDKVQFLTQNSTEFFVQDFIPEYVDILWMVNNQSPMKDVSSHLRVEATKFFQRLDQVSHQYQMGFVNADMQFAKGALQPEGQPIILRKDLGTLEQRTNVFANNVLNNLIYNVRTSGFDKGFESVHTALSNNFLTRPEVPLVLVFISFADDKSEAPTGVDAVDHYVSKFVEMKDGNADLIRVYSINYTDTGDRCTSAKSTADIEKAGFEDRYFRLADQLGGESIDLCSSFADTVDLSGIRLEKLKTRFKLSVPPRANTLQVSVLRDGTTTDTPAWTFDVATNEIVFEVAPPEGTSIVATFLPGASQ